jgi:pilus assembly protein Flp/PilA
MLKFLKLIENEEGATAIEYGLIAALIAVAAIAALTNVGGQLGTTFNKVNTELTNANT